MCGSEVELDFFLPTRTGYLHSIREIGNNGPAYREDYWVWSQVAKFERFLRHSPVGEYTGSTLETERINLMMDNKFYRTVNCQVRAP